MSTFFKSEQNFNFQIFPNEHNFKYFGKRFKFNDIIIIIIIIS